MHTHPIAGPRTFARQADGGFRIVYHGDNTDRCPACAKRQWIVGRVTAECAFCHTALPLDHVDSYGFAPRFVSHPTATRLLPRPI